LLLLFVVAFVLAVLVLAGGSIRSLAAIRFRWPALVCAGLMLQFVIFPLGGGRSPWPALTPALYLLSMLLVGLWTLLNRHIPGVLLAGAGVLCNFLAIAANGGLMPVDPQLAAMAGIERSAPEHLVVHNSIARSAAVQLWFLTDILPVPAIIPFASVFSIGDVLLTAGMCWCLFRTVGKKPHFASLVRSTHTHEG
jgi:hypothetical protein